MDCAEVRFSGHAVRRMFARSLSRDEVLAVVRTGEVIEEYPGDTPFPSVLILGLKGSVPLHVVLGFDSVGRVCYVVTAYEPDPDLWEPGFKVRRRREVPDL
jgi:hypothetical protein